jgi:diguanylate cyclase (GGDEF)-like protein/PAS domain S-box-containing protein
MVLVPTFARTMLRWQIVLVGACCLAIAAIVIGNVAIVAKLRESALDQVRQALERRSFAVAAQANLSLQSVSLVLNAVTERLAPNQIEDADAFRRRGTASNIQQILVQQIVGLPQIEVLGLVDLDGNVINSSRPMRMQFSVADRDYFIAFRDNPALERYVSVPIRSRNSGVQGIVVTQRVLGANGTTVGFVGSFIKLEFFESYWRSVMDHSENESSISLNRFDGTVLARFLRTDVIGTKFADGMQTQLRDANAVVVRKRGSIDGKMRIQAARVLDKYPLFILATQSEDAALAGWRRTAWIAAAEATGGVLVVLIAGFGIWRWWSEHQHRMEAQAGQAVAELARTKAEAAVEILRESERQTARLNGAIEHMSHGLLMFDAQERLVVLNSRFLEMHGLSADAVKPGCSLIELLHHRFSTGLLSEEPESYRAEILEQLSAGRTVTHVLKTTDGREISVVNRPMSDGGWLTTHEDVTERRQSEARIAHMAHHDALTGLANRAALMERVEDACDRCRQSEDQFSILMLDLDWFKQVNDTFGHPAGDELLRQVGARLKAALHKNDLLARLGGDEFAIVQINDTDQGDAAETLAGRIVELLGEPFFVNGNVVNIGASIGIALAPEHGFYADDLLKMADLALYHAKSLGRNRYAMFEPVLGQAVVEKHNLDNELRGALARSEFELHFQPIVDTKTLKMCSAEALVRWRHPKKGLIAPDRFIPFAEETGLILKIGEWVLQKACIEAVKWPSSMKVAVNLSAVQLRSATLLDQIICVLAETGLPPERLELEVTETALIEYGTEAPILLKKLRNLGITVALDDFGTGYSSLSQLTMFPFDKIKIDKSFTRNMTNRADCAAIISAVLALAQSLDIHTTAEGVEKDEQLRILAQAGVTTVQGFLIHRPCPASELNFEAAFVAGAVQNAA